jgi:hypothetical protein
MAQASYNDIAEWYDRFLRARPIDFIPLKTSEAKEQDADGSCVKRNRFP